MNPIKEIKRFQKDRLLDKQDFIHKVEVMHILEELLETIGYESLYARQKAEDIYEKYFRFEPREKKELVDAYADIIVFAIGSIMKLGYEPECVLNEVAKEINSRVGSIIDGKFVKDTSEEAKKNWYKANYDRCLNKDA
jgi:predicted HAD superfamily Cof-like phosphohydrolase